MIACKVYWYLKQNKFVYKVNEWSVTHAWPDYFLSILCKDYNYHMRDYYMYVTWSHSTRLAKVFISWVWKIHRQICNNLSNHFFVDRNSRWCLLYIRVCTINYFSYTVDGLLVSWNHFITDSQAYIYVHIRSDT